MKKTTVKLLAVSSLALLFGIEYQKCKKAKEIAKKQEELKYLDF